MKQATIVRQRTNGDCGVAALAMFAAMSYEDAYVAITKLPTDLLTRVRGKQGLNNSHLVAAAKALAIVLTPTRKYDLDDDDGVLRIRWNGKDTGGHFVTVLNGLVIDPGDGTVMSWRDYLATYKARPCTLLKGTA